MEKLTHFSLCSGIGGLDLAAEWAGFETVAQCEIDEYASKVLAKNFKGVPNLHDIRTVTNERLAECGIDGKKITVISAGFPCQPYSLAGKGRGDRDSRDLWGEVARVLGEIRPPWFVGENTPGLFARQNQRFFRRVLDDLTALGYSVGWGIWGACDVGAPHRRDRVFLLGRNSDGLHVEKEQAIQRGKNAESRRVGRNIPDTTIERCNPNEIQRGEFTESGDEKNTRRVQESRVQFERVCGSIPHSASDVIRSDNGNRTQRDASGEWWQVEPDVGRVVNGISARVDRLRCLGNAVVPAQAYPIFKAIADYNTERAGRSAYYERPAKERKRAKESLRKMKICLNCTKENCTGTCELMRSRNG